MCSHNKKIVEMFLSDKGMELYDRIIKTIEKENMLPLIEKGVLVGFSGGADSIFLISFLIEYKRRTNKSFSLTAVHVNHGIRGDEADRDEEFSRSFLADLEVPFVSVYRDVPAISREEGIGTEEAARNIRYSVFEDLIKSRDDIGAIAVAHNATDNTETVLMNILRGSGISGVCGIKPIRDNIIIQRPDYIIIGNIMILIPGIGITNALRDLFSGDVMTGILRSIEAVLLTLAIALGTILPALIGGVL